MDKQAQADWAAFQSGDVTRAERDASLVAAGLMAQPRNGPIDVAPSESKAGVVVDGHFVYTVDGLPPREAVNIEPSGAPLGAHPAIAAEARRADPPLVLTSVGGAGSERSGNPPRAPRIVK